MGHVLLLQLMYNWKSYPRKSVQSNNEKPSKRKFVFVRWGVTWFQQKEPSCDESVKMGPMS